MPVGASGCSPERRSPACHESNGEIDPDRSVEGPGNMGVSRVGVPPVFPGRGGICGALGLYLDGCVCVRLAPPARRAAAHDVACARNDLRLHHGRDRRLSPDRDPELDRPADAQRRAAPPSVPSLGGGPDHAPARRPGSAGARGRLGCALHHRAARERGAAGRAGGAMGTTGHSVDPGPAAGRQSGLLSGRAPSASFWVSTPASI
jgi:hypothetical protein